MLKKELKIKKNVFQCSSHCKTSKDTSTILLNLGKATKRGIKKCYKCGIYNGTRGLMCKNKQCGAIFKECEEKETNVDATKLVSGTSRQVFSVKVKGKGPDYRGFVQLPLVEGNKATQEADVALSEVALCFVDSCQRLFDDSILKCHEIERNKVVSICIHIKSALKSVNVAVPVETKNCLLHSLNFKDDVKQKLWSLSTETRGVLVQRVSKTVMAVKCQASPKHPLGYLHFTFCISKGNKVIYDNFFCSCLNFKGYGSLNNTDGTINGKCIHFYACIWAFASDLHFTEEFIDFLNIELCIAKPQAHISSVPIQTKKDLAHTNFKPSARVLPSKLNNKLQTWQYYLTKVDTSLHFIDWLASITERINQSLLNHTKDYVESIHCFIPLYFFVLLQARIHCDEKSSNFYTLNRSPGIAYVICNTSYLQQIFDTQLVPLRVMQIHKEMVSFLKVGIAETNDSFTPFTVTWLPSALPVSNFGKLQLIYYIGCCDSKASGTIV